MKFTSKLHLSLQSLALVLQVLNYVAGVVPPKWQPVVAGGVALIQIVMAKYAHGVNPDGTPATAPYVPPAAQTPFVTKPLVLLAFLLVGSSLMAQTAPVDVTTMFAVKTNALNLHIAGANNPGTQINGSYTFLTRGNTNFIATTDELLVPGNNFQGYYAGAEVAWGADKLFKNTTLPKNSLQLYGALEGGIARNVPSTGTATSKPSFFTHAGLNYDPTHTGKFSINLIDGGFVYAPNLGYPNPASNGWTLSLGIKLGLWTKTN